MQTHVKKLGLEFSEDGRWLSLEERMEPFRKEKQAKREAEIEDMKAVLFKQIELMAKMKEEREADVAQMQKDISETMLRMEAA